jgi:hypothetical protein
VEIVGECIALEHFIRNRDLGRPGGASPKEGAERSQTVRVGSTLEGSASITIGSSAREGSSDGEVNGKASSKSGMVMLRLRLLKDGAITFFER